MLNLKLIDGAARLWWRRWSTWLAAVFAAVMAAIAWNPGLLLGLLGYFPGAPRAFISGVIFVICFVVPVVVALLKQPKLQDKADGGGD